MPSRLHTHPSTVSQAFSCSGFVPSVIAIGPQTGLQFGFYSLFNQLLGRFHIVAISTMPTVLTNGKGLLNTGVLVTAHDDKLGEKRITMLGSIACGGLAGILDT